MTASGGGVAARAGEQRLLGCEILFHRMVKIQMIPRQIREDRAGEIHAVHPPQCQRVGRDLHGHVRPALRRQFRKNSVQVERFRRGVDRRQHAARQMILDGPDHGRSLAGRAQNRIDQVGRSSFCRSCP